MLPREQELTVGLSWVLTMRNLRARLDVAGESLLWRAVWQSGGVSLSLHPFLPQTFNLRVTATVGNSLII